MLLGVLHLVSDAEDPWEIVATLMDAVPQDDAPEGTVSAHGGVARKVG
jgi:hypothetical protein